MMYTRMVKRVMTRLMADNVTVISEGGAVQEILSSGFFELSHMYCS